MPKGYLVANIRVTDAEKFQAFAGMAAPAIKKYGGKVLARGPLADRHEGKLTGTVMMIEFDSKQAAETFYFSDEYQAAKAVRDTCSDTDLMIIEGAEQFSFYPTPSPKQPNYYESKGSLQPHGEPRTACLTSVSSCDEPKAITLVRS